MEVTREDLFALAAKPLGDPELHARVTRDPNGARGNPEVKAMVKRIAKTWLPLGRRSVTRGACNEPGAAQTDIEDAVEAAGGARGQASRRNFIA